MDSPLQLETAGLPVSSHLQEIIDGHVRQLEDRFGRMTAMRLAIRAPGGHHRMGAPMAVSIQIALPGSREINVKPVSNDRDPRQADIVFAVNDAFRRATVQLERHGSDLNDRPKQRHGAETGRISHLDEAKACGSLTTEDKREIYFHANSVLGGKFDKLSLGDKVAYHEESGQKGPQASTVRLLKGGRHD